LLGAHGQPQLVGTLSNAILAIRRSADEHHNGFEHRLEALLSDEKVDETINIGRVPLELLGTQATLGAR
jgi:hypothetical protein